MLVDVVKIKLKCGWQEGTYVKLDGVKSLCKGPKVGVFQEQTFLSPSKQRERKYKSWCGRVEHYGTCGENRGQIIWGFEISLPKHSSGQLCSWENTLFLGYVSAKLWLFHMWYMDTIFFFMATFSRVVNVHPILNVWKLCDLMNTFLYLFPSLLGSFAPAKKWWALDSCAPYWSLLS